MTKATIDSNGVVTVTDIPSHVQYGDRGYIMGETTIDNPLPFNEIKDFGGISAESAARSFQTFAEGQSTEGRLSLVDRLEAYGSKSYLMSHIMLDNAGVSAGVVRKFVLDGLQRYPNREWWLWKAAICEVTGKSWPECAELIYGEMF
jgi:hypothetical protein